MFIVDVIFVGIKCLVLVLLNRPKRYKKYPCSTQLSTKFNLLINVTMVGILTVISMIHATPERHFFVFIYFSFYEQLKFCAQLG